MKTDIALKASRLNSIGGVPVRFKSHSIGASQSDSQRHMKFELLIFMAMLVAALCCAPTSSAQASDVYITPDGSGQGVCTNSPHPPAWFNNASNWGTGQAQIGPGTTVHLCGTIASPLAAQGSGNSNSPVTILFETAAALSEPACSTACLTLDNKSYIVVNGGKPSGAPACGPSVTCNGSIQNTANGTTLANHVSALAISANGSSNIEIQNLLIANMYVHTSVNDTTLSAPGPGCVHFYGSGGSISFHNNVVHDVAWCLNGDGNNISVFNNEIYNFDHAIGMGTFTTGTVQSNFAFHDNYIHDTANWDTSNNSFHHDGIHLFYYCDNSVHCAQSQIQNVTIYNNKFSGNWGNNNTSQIFLEAGCTNCQIYNNVSLPSTGGNGYLNDGNFNVQGTNVSIYNNTLMGGTTSNGTGIQIGGPNVTFQNNVMTTFNQCVGTASEFNATTSSYLAVNNNVYANCGSNAFVWCPPNGSTCTFGNFSQWKAACQALLPSCDTSSEAIPNALLSSNGSPQSGSAVFGYGANFTGLGLPTLNEATSAGDTLPPVPRPGGTAPWDVGAYASSLTTTQPAAPSGLVATIN